MSEITKFYERNVDKLRQYFSNINSFSTWLGSNQKVQELIPDETYIVEQIINIRRETWNKKKYVNVGTWKTRLQK